jgi:hypothetical protein
MNDSLYLIVEGSPIYLKEASEMFFDLNVHFIFDGKRRITTGVHNDRVIDDFKERLETLNQFQLHNTLTIKTDRIGAN